MRRNVLFPATLMPDSDWWHDLWSDPGAVLEKIGMHPAMDVVDLCCGNGHFTKDIAALIAPGNLYAVDLNAELLAEAQAVTGQTNCKKIQFILSDACNLAEYITDSVDMVFLANTFHGVPDKEALSASIAKIVKPGGSFVIVNWHKRPREDTVVFDQARGPDTHLRMSADDVCTVVEPAGFLLDKVIDVGPYHYAAIFLKKI